MPIVNRRVKSVLRRFMPARLRHAMLRRQARHDRYQSGTLTNIFSAIYRDGIWGSGADFMSGAGSHQHHVVGPYVDAVRDFAAAMPTPLTAVDLGCGDFAVGRELVRFFSAYRACDVVPALVDRNRAKFVDDRLSFHVVDIVSDALPPGDVAFVRQVFQHLSNDQIAAVLPKLDAYRYVIVTEHIPAGDFIANQDKAAGPHTRFDSGSGVALEQEPFNVARRRQVLCLVEDEGTIFETVLWS